MRLALVGRRAQSRRTEIRSVSQTGEESSAHTRRELHVAGVQATESASISLARTNHQFCIAQRVVEVPHDAS
jgi:hypothetical protein